MHVKWSVILAGYGGGFIDDHVIEDHDDGAVAVSWIINFAVLSFWISRIHSNIILSEQRCDGQTVK